MVQHNCLLCDKSVDADQLDLHISVQHFHHMPYRCEKCDFSCPTSSVLQNHFVERGHGDAQQIVEPQKSSSYLTDLISLISTSCQAASVLEMSEILENLELPTAGADSAAPPQKSKLSNPTKRATKTVGLGGYKSRQCGRRFVQRRNLSRHSICHRNVRLPCDQCKRKYAGAHGLRAHKKRKHSGLVDRQFECPHCPKAFVAKGGLNQHLLVHGIVANSTEQRPLVASDWHKCPVQECQKPCVTKQRLQQHMLVHSNNSYYCDECPARYSLKGNLTTHKRLEHSD